MISVVLAGWPAFWLIVLGVVALATLPWLLQAAVISVLDIIAAALRHGVELLGTDTADDTVPLPAVTAPVCVDTACTVVQMPDGTVIDLRTTTGTTASTPADSSGPPLLVGVGLVVAVVVVAVAVMRGLGRRRVEQWHDNIVTSVGQDGRLATPEPAP